MTAARQEELDRCAADHSRRLERELALARAEAAAQLGQALEAARAEYHQRVDAEVARAAAQPQRRGTGQHQPARERPADRRMNGRMHTPW